MEFCFIFALFPPMLSFLVDGGVRGKEISWPLFGAKWYQGLTKVPVCDTGTKIPPAINLGGILRVIRDVQFLGWPRMIVKMILYYQASLCFYFDIR